jgi:hypothetical protein
MLSSPKRSPKRTPPQREDPDAEEMVDIWIIEGRDELDDAGICHKNAFYVPVKEWYTKRDYTCTLPRKQRYNKIVQFCLNLINGADFWALFLVGNKQAYKWQAKYHAVAVGESAVLVMHPKDTAVDAQFLCLLSLKQPTYAERAFLNLKIHRVDHCKGTTFSKRTK